MLTLEGKGSPAKSKVRDDRRWRANWWDFHPLVDDLHRPAAWSNSSTIFTAHLTQPIVLGRLFPSSKQFLVVSPDPILHSPASYKPPSVISVSPNDHWLFAFYPSHTGDGIACLWNRGCHVDAWIVKEYWSFSRGADVITAAWAGTEREWSTSPDGSSSRLPSRGPLTPVSNPTLLLVTQSHQLHVCYLRTYVSSLKMLFCSLTLPYHISEGQSIGAVHDTPAGPRTSRLCMRATIAFIYGESSILVAMRSRRYPTTDSLKSAAYHDLDLGLSLDLSQPHGPSSEDRSPPLEFGALAEEQTIELCEVKLRFDGMLMSLISQPLPPLHHPFPHLTGLTFVCSPSPKPDPSTSPKTSPKKDKQSVRPVAEPPSTFLVASFLDFEDYSSTPKSVAVVYVLARTPLSSTPVKTPWSIHQVGERSFFPRVLTFACPGLVSPHPRKGVVLALLADVGGSVSQGSQKTKEVAVGNLTVLQLPDLTDAPDWESVPMMALTGRAGMDWPINIVMSRNQVLLCATSLGRMSIHALPKHLRILNSADPTPRSLSSTSMALVTSLQSRRSIADITHALIASAMPLDAIVEILKETWTAFETNMRAGVIGFTATDILGATVELYKAKASQIVDTEEKQFLESLWRNAHDMCSMIACFMAFEDCRYQEGYDLEAVWQLVSLSEWAIGFLERLIKECLSVVDLTEPTLVMNEVQLKIEPLDDMHPSTLSEADRHYVPSPLDSPVLIHLAHPSTLTNLIAVVIHVNRFYHSLSSLTPKGENAQIARDILMDIIGCSGLDLKGLEEVFKGAIPDVRSIPGDEGKLALAKCHPVPSQHGFLRKILHTLSTSPAIDKPRLFIKAGDFVDGFANLSTSEQSSKEQERDVVTKGVLLRRRPGLLCLRCGYRSEVGGEVIVAGHASYRWKTWMKMWATRCICGGSWVSGNG